MKNCPKCGTSIEEDALFCINCGSNLKELQINNSSVKNPYESKKIQALKGFAYMVLFIEIVVILGLWYHVKMVNADRLMLYPLLCVFLAFFSAFRLVEYEETYRDSIIVVVVSIILFVLSLIVV